MHETVGYVYDVVRIHCDGRLCHPCPMLDPRVILPTYRQPQRPAGEAAIATIAPVEVALGVTLVAVVGGMFWFVTKR